LLFINMEPSSIFHPKLITDIPASQSSRVVFEITEHAAISDFGTFRQAAQIVKEFGLKLAIDDVGSAYSGLRIISMIEPDYIKLDMELTREAHRNRVKMELLKAIAGFCTDAEIPMIVEGIESEEELETVRQLGVGLVQGYMMGRPATMRDFQRGAVSDGATPRVTGTGKIVS
jgi:EAL domain-containing protein (putative c-di-GMP-specific phosphodiesterase class I)